jgi:hypothetical protein
VKNRAKKPKMGPVNRSVCLITRVAIISQNIRPAAMIGVTASDLTSIKPKRELW